MAVEADRVVVELVAQTEGFDAKLRQSGQNFTSTMEGVTKASKDVETAADEVYTAHNRMGIATNNARIAQMELQHVVRGSVDSYASGAGAAQIFAQHIASVAEAASFMGGSLGAVGEFLAGPWGIAVTASVALIATLIAHHKEETNTVEGLTEKLKKHHDQTMLQAEADERWSHTLEGLIDNLNKLNEETGKKLELPNLSNRQSFVDAQRMVDGLNRMIDAAEKNPNVSTEDIQKLYDALAVANTQLRLQTSVLGEQIGGVFSDMKKQADDWAQYQENKIRYLTGVHPELGQFRSQIEGAFGEVKKAVDDAAAAGIPFDSFTKRVDALNEQLRESPNSLSAYVKGLRDIGAELEKIASVKPDEAIKRFEQAVIGAEGTGPNRMGSSAAGIGQFMPSTWLQYFNRLFPQFANMTDAAKLDERNNPSAAKAVIEAAAKDYADALKRAGITITETALYTMHLLGSRDALKLLNAAPGQSTSDFLSSKVLSGNPFLQGTASDALAAISKRIGDSSSSVSSAAVEMAKQLSEWNDKNAQKVADYLGKETEVKVVKEHQVESAAEYLALHTSLDELIKRGILPSLKDWDKEFKQITDSMAEAKREGAALVDDVLNPDNWHSWGQAAHTVIHDLLNDLLTLGAANPLKNLLFGSNLPTLGGVFKGLFGGIGGGGGGGAFVAANGGLDFSSSLSAIGGLPHFATGGVMGVDGSGGDNNLLSINGRPRAFVGGNEKLAIIPKNAIAASPGGSSGSVVRVLVEASPYFDGRVMEVSGPVIARSAVAAANGGATLSRRNLGRESMHRLE